MNKRIILALIAIIPACLTAVLGYLQGANTTDSAKAERELRRKAIMLNRSANPNFRALTYPNYGLSLSIPVSWTLEDGPARLAGGEFNVVQRYEETKGAVGINFRLRPVQPNYISDAATQVQNQKDTFEKTFGSVVIKDCSISGAVGKVFEYEAPTGKRKMRVKLYWIRVVPEVQLQIQCAQYTDAADAEDFWKNADQVLSSIVIAFDSWQARSKRNPGA
jgi:hypothetical protein